MGRYLTLYIADSGPLHAGAEGIMDVEREKKRLLQRDAEWGALADQGQDVERILSYWTEDARVIPPGMPALSGKAAIRAFVEGALATPGFHIAWTSADPILSPDGQLAYLLGTNTVTMPGPDGKPQTTRGRGLTVWRREPDGEWRCTVDIWNDEPAGP